MATLEVYDKKQERTMKGSTSVVESLDREHTHDETAELPVVVDLATYEGKVPNVSLQQRC